MREFIGAEKWTSRLHVESLKICKEMAKSLHIVDDMSKKERNFDMSDDGNKEDL